MQLQNGVCQWLKEYLPTCSGDVVDRSVKKKTVIKVKHRSYQQEVQFGCGTKFFLIFKYYRRMTIYNGYLMFHYLDRPRT